MTPLRYLWASPASAAGLILAALACATGATIGRVDGTLEIAGGGFGRAARCLPRGFRCDAITFGHVILGRDHATLAALRAHERVHVAQYERWGALFVPLYLLSSLAAWLRGDDPYRANRFEREACAGARGHAIGRRAASGARGVAPPERPC